MSWFVRAGTLHAGPLLCDAVSVGEAGNMYDRLRNQPQRLLGAVPAWLAAPVDLRELRSDGA